MSSDLAVISCLGSAIVYGLRFVEYCVWLALVSMEEQQNAFYRETAELGGKDTIEKASVDFV